jgi:hypothetical protein
VNSGLNQRLIEQIKVQLESEKRNESFVRYLYARAHAEENALFQITSKGLVGQNWLPVAGGVAPNLTCPTYCGPAISSLGGTVVSGRTFWFPQFLSGK